MKKIISTISLLLVCSSIAMAQQKITVTAGVDLVSAYIWRGTYNAGASFQPTLKGQLYGLTLGAWGSTDFIGEHKKEVDLSLSYSIKGLTFGVVDYWWEGESALKYFTYGRHNTAHRVEGNIAYQLPVENFPLIVSWNTMFAGNDYTLDGKRAYSSYVELLYPFTAGSIDMTAAIGATPWLSPSILPSNNKDLSVCNISIGASKAIKLSDEMSMPVFTKLIFNPAIEDIHFVFGLSLYFNN